MPRRQWQVSILTFNFTFFSHFKVLNITAKTQEKLIFKNNKFRLAKANRFVYESVFIFGFFWCDVEREDNFLLRRLEHFIFLMNEMRAHLYFANYSMRKGISTHFWFKKNRDDIHVYNNTFFHTSNRGSTLVIWLFFPPASVFRSWKSIFKAI